MQPDECRHPQVRDVVIVGAGIAGLALARFLSTHGIESSVLEQAPTFADVGAGLQLAPNATRLLHRLGLGAALADVAVPLESRRVFDHRGALVHETPLGLASTRRFGAPYVAVHRARLHEVLRGAPGEIEVLEDTRVVSVSEGTGDARVTCASGASYRVPLVVGADGIRSTVRAGLVGDQPTYSGTSVFRAVVSDEGLAWPDDPAGRERVRVFAAGTQHAVVYPLGRGLLNLVATIPRKEWSGPTWVCTASREEMLAAYQGWAPALVEVLARADGAEEWGLFERPLLSSWSGEHTTMIGDAAHPMLPFLAQGANQAVEDAAALAWCLGPGRDGTMGKALRAFERCRRERAHAVVAASTVPASRRDHAGGSPTGDPLAAFDWLYRHDPEDAARREAGQRLTLEVGR